MKPLTSAIVLSRVLGTWGFHPESIANDVSVTMELTDQSGATTRQTMVVYADVDLEGVTSGTKPRNAYELVDELLGLLDVKSDVAVAAVLSSLNAKLASEMPPITGTTPSF